MHKRNNLPGGITYHNQNGPNHRQQWRNFIKKIKQMKLEAKKKKLLSETMYIN